MGDLFHDSGAAKVSKGPWCGIDSLPSVGGSGASGGMTGGMKCRWWRGGAGTLRHRERALLVMAGIWGEATDGKREGSVRQLHNV